MFDFFTLHQSVCMLNFILQLQSLLDDVRRETEVLRSQLSTERATKQGLEGLLQDNHTKGWQTQMTIQEKDTEIQVLKDRLAIIETKMCVCFQFLLIVYMIFFHDILSLLCCGIDFCIFLMY